MTNNKIIDVKRIIPPAIGISMVMLLWALLNSNYNVFFSIGWAIMAFILSLGTGLVIEYVRK